MEEYNQKRNRSNEDRTLKELSPNVAGLLCYVGGWVGGLIFLVLEQKNRFVRFHAIQSIIVFGFLTVAGGILGRLPVIGPGFFSWAIGLTGFILWIILMVKAYRGELFQLPWAGDWAAKIVYESGSDSTDVPPASGPTNPNAETANQGQSVPPAIPLAITGEGINSGQTANDVPPAAPVYHRPNKSEQFKARYYSNRAHYARITGSAFAIAWSLAWLIFFNFFHQYIAFYEQGDSNQWIVHTLVTADFIKWLPIISVTLIISIIGHAIVIGYDKYWARSILHISGDILSVAAVLTLLAIFPFDFSSIPGADSAQWAKFGLSAGLILTAIGCGIGAFARFITLIIHIAERRY